MKNVDDLMKPRYEVIADWPDSDLPVGQVLTNWFPGMWGNDNYEFKESKLWFERYPHLFKKLSWWEHRKPEEMPEYLKEEDGEKVGKLGSKYEGNLKDCITVFYQGGGVCSHLDNWLPATEQDYLNYLKTIKPPID